MIEATAERWLPVEGWGHIEVSDLGRVRSKDRIVERRCGALLPVRGRIVKTHHAVLRGRKYGPMVNVRDSIAGRKTMLSVRRLVWSSFNGDLAPSDQVMSQHPDPANAELRYLFVVTRPQIGRWSKIGEGTALHDDHKRRVAKALRLEDGRL